GLPKDLASAKAWSEKAADRGNVKAMHNVGVFLAQGVQGKPDYATAVTWFRKAAERNVRDSQFNLGILMARGLGTPRDFKGSYVWFALAARDGDADSAAKRDEVAQRLTNAELDQAKASVANFKPIEADHAANEVDVKDIKWDRIPPGSGEADAGKTNKL
ncbi:MAG: sel1 repeat family protein, partial [Hyphomicrobiales bacterium]|nr:sel1 repeat family protein [Hyphomicrobiales bacterium]